jgi:hypothetical protein
MEHEWDSNKGGRDQRIGWLTEILIECRRVLKPGAHALLWALPKTSHWTATALEDAGFEIRDVISHVFGTGLPKSWHRDGQGTALKPASEHWILARAPLDGTAIKTVETHRTGALQIDACRVNDRWPSNFILSIDQNENYARYTAHSVQHRRSRSES